MPTIFYIFNECLNFVELPFVFIINFINQPSCAVYFKNFYPNFLILTKKLEIKLS